MRNQLHLMLDIETMCTGVHASVVAIGARLFTMKDGPGKGFEAFIDPDAAAQYGEVCTDTMNWWHKQPAFALVFGGKTQPADALHRFIMFVQEHKPDTVWANSPQLQLTFPFHYRDERDFRTLKAAAVDLKVNLDGCWEGMTAHSPLDDATAQAKAIVICMNRLLSTPEVRSGQGSVIAPRETLHLPGAAASKPAANPQ
jgi:hypothetical protein